MATEFQSKKIRTVRTPVRLPHVNFRVFTVSACGMIFGILLFLRIRFGGLTPSDFFFFAVLLAFLLKPCSPKRFLSVALAFALFAGLGAGASALYAKNFAAGPQEGDHAVAGTVVSCVVWNGRADVVLSDLVFDGRSVGGKMQAVLPSEEVRPGDIVSFESRVERSSASGNSAFEYLFSRDLRYTAVGQTFERVGKSKNPFLRLNAALYDRLTSDMGASEALTAYALLTGDSHGMDAGILEKVQRGGIAHIFAVSGLHIGILFAAAMLVFKKPLKKYAVIPALALAALYTAFCGFSVSSSRALIMCAAAGLYRAFGRKYDFLQSVSLAALVVLAFRPADFLSAGFRLSFGACAGLTLFSGTFRRAFARIPHFPRAVAGYLAANLSVQLFTFPILLDCFGYFSVWSFLTNLLFIPLLPAFFLPILLFSFLALAVPPAAAVFLAVPKGLLSLFLLVVTAGRFSFVLTGFSLGTGSVVWLTACVVLSERVRLRLGPRLFAAAGFALLFTLTVLFENVVFSGCRIDTCAYGKGNAALVRTRSAAVLIIDGEISLDNLGDFLNRRHAGSLDAVFVLSEDELSAINRAAYLPAKTIYARDEIATGLRETPLSFGETAECKGLSFRYAARGKLSLAAEGVVVEFDYENSAALGADLFIGSGCGGLKFSFSRGIIKKI